jgi:hypothetical protein
MIRRPGDKTPDPPGGRAAERLRMFERSRGATDATPEPQQKKPDKRKRKDAPRDKGVPSDEKQNRSED